MHFQLSGLVCARVTLRFCNIRRISLSLSRLVRLSRLTASESVESSLIGWHEASGSTNRETGARQAEGGQRERREPPTWARGQRRRGKRRRRRLEGGGGGRGVGRFSMVKSRSACGRSAVADEPRLCKVPRRAARAALQRDRQTAYRLLLLAGRDSNQDIKKARNSWLPLSRARVNRPWISPFVESA